MTVEGRIKSEFWGFSLAYQFPISWLFWLAIWRLRITERMITVWKTQVLAGLCLNRKMEAQLIF
jgi:hypothetical protein